MTQLATPALTVPSSSLRPLETPSSQDGPRARDLGPAIHRVTPWLRRALGSPTQPAGAPDAAQV